MQKQDLAGKKPDTGSEEFNFKLNKGLDPSLNISPRGPGFFTGKKKIPFKYYPLSLEKERKLANELIPYTR